MGHYKSNLRDIEFTLFEVLGRQEVLGTGPYAEVDEDTARSILDEVDRLATGPLAESLARVRPQAAGLRPGHLLGDDAGGVQEVLPGLHGRRVVADGPARGARRHRRPALACAGRSPSSILGSNPAVHMYASGMAFAHVSAGSAPRSSARSPSGWSTAAGAPPWCSPSRTPAPTWAPAAPRRSQQPDGTWHIEGVKRFITSAEHDMSENIVHLVLARPEGAGPGTKGLSLFVVPKIHFDWDTGELGERNGAYVTNVEHKMGLKASTTCELTFGEKEPAVGWLVGDVHDGIAQMFKIIEFARMMVGTKAIATLSTGYLNALEYAKSRVQGADLTQMTDKAAPRVTITHHPDVRRSLMTQKAYAEGMRALVALHRVDPGRGRRRRGRRRRERRARPRRTPQRPAAADRQGLRLGEVLRAARLAVAADLRRLGLPAGLPAGAVHPGRQDRHPLRGHHGDPGHGLLLPQDRAGQGPGAHQADDRHPGVRQGRRGQRRAAGRARAARQGSRGRAGHRRHDGRLADRLRRGGHQHLQGRPEHHPPAARVRRPGGRPGCCSGRPPWPRAALEAGATGKDAAFYTGKVAAASFFAHQVLPLLSAQKAVAEGIDNSLMDLPEDAF